MTQWESTHWYETWLNERGLIDTRINEFCFLSMSHVSYQWVVSLINESCHTYQWVTSRINESCLLSMSHVAYAWVMLHTHESHVICISHVSFECITSHMNACLTSMTHVSHQWLMSLINDSCLTTMTHVSYEWLMSCARARSLSLSLSEHANQCLRYC